MSSPRPAFLRAETLQIELLCHSSRTGQRLCQDAIRPSWCALSRSGVVGLERLAIPLGLVMVIFSHVCSHSTCGSQLSSRADMLRRVNDSKFGLQAGVFTHDMDKAFYAFEHMEVKLPASRSQHSATPPYSFKPSIYSRLTCR